MYKILMKSYLLLFLLFIFPAIILGQTKGLAANPDAVDAKGNKAKPPIELYKIITANRDTIHLDSTLTIQKQYKFNYLRKDNFELLPFSNVGQTYNSLAYTFDDLNLKPKFVAQSHHFNYQQIDDINYYNVPTPLSELYFKTAFNQGQQLDAFFTINTSPQFNFSLEYKGVRSLGQYQHNLTSTGNFIFTANYKTKNDRYNIRTHFAAQDVLNLENGGLTTNSLNLYVTDNPEFTDRGRLDVNFTDGENKLEGIRFYAEHEYALIRNSDSLSHNVFSIGNIISYEDRFYEYRQTNPFLDFGPAYVTTNLLDNVKLEDFNTKGYVHLDNSLIGKITAWAGYTDYNYGYNSVLNLDAGRIENRLKGNLIEVGGAYEKEYRGFELSGKGAINLSGDFTGNYLQGSAGYALDADNKVKASITVHSVAPNFNFLLYQSDYQNYNWQTDFQNVKTQELKFQLKSKKLLDASVSYTGIDDYTYFALNSDSLPKPKQADVRVDYLKIKAERTFKYGNIALANTIMYQKVVSGEGVLNVPQLVTRNSLYYEDHWFKRALFLQTGVTFKYFSEYNMNGYDPVLSEFYVQNDQKLGGFPLFDIFFNAKVRQTRIFFTWENFNQLFQSSNNQFSAPNVPYRDAVIRFGLVWDFFL